MLESALAYAEARWSVVPVAPRSKQPLVPWLEFQQRRALPEEIRDWLLRWPEANLAVVTGAVSNLVVLDIDPRHGGEAALQLLEDDAGPVPSTVEAVTGSGGGLVLVPPSLHPCGRRYAWATRRGPTEAEPAPWPPRLLAEVAGRGGRQGHPPAYWRSLVAEGVPEGRRNSTITSLAGHLLWHDVDPDVVAELLLCWNRVRCRPPLSDDEVLRTVASITRLHRQDGPPERP